MTSGELSGPLCQLTIRGSKGTSEKLCTETCMMLPGELPPACEETSVIGALELGAGGEKWFTLMVLRPVLPASKPNEFCWTMLFTVSVRHAPCWSCEPVIVTPLVIPTRTARCRVLFAKI